MALEQAGVFGSLSAPDVYAPRLTAAFTVESGGRERRVCSEELRNN